MLGTPGASSRAPAGLSWVCESPAAAAGVAAGSERPGLDEGGPSGVRSTRGPTAGWELSEPVWAAAGLLWGEDWVAIVGPEAPAVSVVLCAVLKFSGTELAAVEGSEVTTCEVASAQAGLFVWGRGEMEWVRGGRWGKSEEKKKVET